MSMCASAATPFTGLGKRRYDRVSDAPGFRSGLSPPPLCGRRVSARRPSLTRCGNPAG
jgi:hypothetical protein